MKRIAIISSFGWINVANNYGALLQYYALQQYLYHKGHYAFWIKYVIQANKFTTFKTAFKRVMMNPKIAYKSFACHKTFMQYCKDYLNLSDDKYTEENIIDSYPLADYYLTGSDQVWGGAIPANYLTFVNDDDKKIAYAVSFGKSTISSEHAQKIAPWVKAFKYISVREETGIKICESLGCKAEHLLDPTLLLDAENYPHTNRFVSRNYIFSYFLNINNLEDVRFIEIKNYAQKIEAKLKVCTVQGSQYHFCYKDLVFPSPIEWITYYRNANLIVTNTFHGTVFAIIHHRPFVCILQSGNSAQQNTRMTSLLDMFELTDRILRPKDRIEDIVGQKIEWGRVDEVLTVWREKTDAFFNFLK